MATVTELRTATPFSLILFGASGHLAKLKLYPALYVLALKKRLPEKYAVLGFARTQMSDTVFRDLVAESIRAALLEVNEGVLKEFLHHCHYHIGSYDDPSSFRLLQKQLEKLELPGQWVRMAYLSIPPELFPAVLRNLCEGGIHTHELSGDFRCIIEKPVGHDLGSFENIYKDITTCFTEDEVYLLDHYLGKEAVRNIYYLRFANPILERLFKNSLIDHVEVTAMESAGIEGRAGYFENAGTFRDMFQSHLLEICALLTMRLRDDDIGLVQSRASALEQFYLPPASDLQEIILQGQYSGGTTDGKRVPAYREESGVAPHSQTNTFVTMSLLSRTSRWQGVPFYLRSGKRLQRKETRITVQFQVPHSIGKGSAPNRLDIILQGEAGMRLHLQTKMGGTEPCFRPLVLEDPLVCVGDCLPEHGLLLLEAIHGKRTWFLGFDEVRTCWRLLDPLQTFLENSATHLHFYPAGTDGPEEAHTWIGQRGSLWL